MKLVHLGPFGPVTGIILACLSLVWPIVFIKFPSPLDGVLEGCIAGRQAIRSLFFATGAAFAAFTGTTLTGAASAAALLGTAGFAVVTATAACAFFAGGTFGFIAVAGVYVFVRLLAAGGLGLGRGGGLQQVFQFF